MPPEDTRRRASRTASGPRVGSMLAKAMAISECFWRELDDFVVGHSGDTGQPLVHGENNEAHVARAVVMSERFGIAGRAAFAEILACRFTSSGSGGWVPGGRERLWP